MIVLVNATAPERRVTIVCLGQASPASSSLILLGIDVLSCIYAAAEPCPPSSCLVLFSCSQSVKDRVALIPRGGRKASPGVITPAPSRKRVQSYAFIAERQNFSRLFFHGEAEKDGSGNKRGRFWAKRERRRGRKGENEGASRGRRGCSQGGEDAPPTGAGRKTEGTVGSI